MRVAKYDGLYEAASVELLANSEDRKLLIDVHSEDGRRASITLSFEVAASLKAQLDAIAAEHPEILKGHRGSSSRH